MFKFLGLEKLIHLLLGLCFVDVEDWKVDNIIWIVTFVSESNILKRIININLRKIYTK